MRFSHRQWQRKREGRLPGVRLSAGTVPSFAVAECDEVRSVKLGDLRRVLGRDIGPLAEPLSLRLPCTWMTLRRCTLPVGAVCPCCEAWAVGEYLALG